MKKLLFGISSLLLFLIIHPNKINAQENVVKINVTELIFTDIDIAYERVIRENQSFQVGAYLGKAVGSHIDHNNIGLSASYRMYFDILKIESDIPHGLYGGPFIRYRRSKTDTGDLSFINLGGLAGYQYLLNDRFSFEGFLGYYYNLKLSESGELNTDAAKYNGKTSFTVGATVGIAF